VQGREGEKCESLNSIRTFIAPPEIHIQAIDCPVTRRTDHDQIMIQKKIRSSSEMPPIDLELALDLYSDVDEVKNRSFH